MIMFKQNVSYIYIYIYIYAVLGLGCCVGFSLVVDSRGYSLVVVLGLLIVVASFVGQEL